MRVLYWTREFFPAIGGIEELSRQALPAFQKRNYELLVVAAHGTHNLPDVTSFNGIPVHRFHFQEALGRRDPRAILAGQHQVAQLKKSFNPDLVHVHFGDPCGYFHVTTASVHPAPSLVTVHTMVGYPTGPDTVVGRLLGRAAWVAGVSEASLTEIRRAVPATIERSSVIYNGLDLPALAPRPLDFDQPCILCLGRAVRDKGFDLALAAFADVRKRFPKSRLIIAGDGLARAALERQTLALELADAVEFLGWVEPEAVPALINRATIVVVPSRCQDSFPLVALQAAQMAKPVVAARVGGLPEAVVDRATGVLVDKEDPHQLADAINSLLQHAETAREYGTSGRARAQRLFSLTRYIDAYDSLYQQLVNGTRHPGAIHNQRGLPADRRDAEMAERGA
jgi:glycogen(starch) synthase